MELQALLLKIKSTPETVEFNDVIETIDSHFQYRPTEFVNGETVNQAGTNEGSCKIFAFAQMHQLSQQETLNCFGHYYREHVLQHPDNTDHANIRQFMLYGWKGIHFNNSPLTS